VKDQTLLDASARYKNLEGALTLKKLPVRVQEVFLIDDLVTTGATLNEAVKTLEMGGFRVVGAVTALVSLPLR
jgi:predicted amidophosphoribosyltransferase